MTSAQLVLVHDMSFVARRSEETRRYLFYFFAALSAAIALITVVIAQLSWRGWVQGLRALLRGEGILRPSRASTAPELRPIARDLRELIRDLERQYRPLDGSQRIWDQQALRATLRSELHGNDVIVVSNREPYIHTRTAEGIRLQHPASGLVTALEPVMRACSGTWIAHGSGSADRETVDRSDRVAVPPEHPIYQLRRIWLTKEEEAGYYAGFANEGLWPLCHIAHVRPTFRSSDFEYYRTVNTRFADAVVAESQTKDPVVLVQDYHFALLPQADPRTPARGDDHHVLAHSVAQSRVVRDLPVAHRAPRRAPRQQHHRLPHAVPLQQLPRHRRSADRGARRPRVVHDRPRRPDDRRAPLSDLDRVAAGAARHCAGDSARRGARSASGSALPSNHMIGIGIDRLDYTKGIIERFNAVARLLEMEPRWIGRFTFVQIAAPSRSTIDDYRDYAAHVRARAAEINERYADAKHAPIVLLVEHHEPDSVYEHHRAADLCFVSSLHDGMNLVAKEFVAARDDEQGVLILSQFTGASRELPEALIVNPYDADQCAAALHLALTMPADEQRDRMRFMRGVVREFNVYRWAGRMLLDAAVMRQRGRIRTTEDTVRHG